jgi:hypothetical protein
MEQQITAMQKEATQLRMDAQARPINMATYRNLADQIDMARADTESALSQINRMLATQPTKA